MMLIRRLKYRGTRGAIFRRTYDLVRENHIEKMLDEYPQLRPMYFVGDKELRLPNGSVIAFRYAENEQDVMANIGKEYMDIVVDQAEAFTERELNILKSCCRWPRMSSSQCKFVLTFNPGNVSHNFLKRIFYDRKYQDNEQPDDYAFIQAYGWDNVEWARCSLAEEGLGPYEYYNDWTEDQRFQYFITKTQQGRELNALPQALRIGWLLGRMDQFAGQYFDIFSRDKHVAKAFIEPWMDRWIGIDWGFAHNAAAEWCAQIRTTLTSVYREFVASGRSPKALAQEIVDRTPPEERRYVRGIGLSHDAFAQRDERDSYAKQMNEVFAQAGMPRAVSAGKDVVGTAARIYEMFRSNEIIIDPSCANLIETLPMVTRDETDPERTIKFAGDDSFDACKHSLQVRQPPTKVPPKVQLMAQAAEIKDPFKRWWFLRQHGNPREHVRFHQRVGPQFGREYVN